MDEKITALIAQITLTFQDVLRGDGISLHETYVLDEYGNAEWRQEARSWDTDVHWWEVPEEDLARHGSFLCYLDDLGWHYYLPAYLIHSLKIFDHPRTGVTDFRSYALEILTYFEQSDYDRWDERRVSQGLPPRWRHPDRGEPGIREKQKWATLTTAQSQAVCQYLRFVTAQDDSRFSVRDTERGLRQYWGQFCDADCR